MNNFWIWLIIGIMPYYINRLRGKNRLTLEVRAIFWSLEYLQYNGHHQWILRFPLIEHLRK